MLIKCKLSSAGSCEGSGLSAGKWYTWAASFHISAIILAYEMTNFPDSLYSLAAFMSALLSQSHLVLPSETFFRYPSFFTLSFLHSDGLFFFFCPSSICHLYFAATIFCTLSGLHSITRFSTSFSLLFITPSIFILSLHLSQSIDFTFGI